MHDSPPTHRTACLRPSRRSSVSPLVALIDHTATDEWLSLHSSPNQPNCTRGKDEIDVGSTQRKQNKPTQQRADRPNTETADIALYLPHRLNRHCKTTKTDPSPPLSPCSFLEGNASTDVLTLSDLVIHPTERFLACSIGVTSLSSITIADNESAFSDDSIIAIHLTKHLTLSMWTISLSSITLTHFLIHINSASTASSLVECPPSQSTHTHHQNYRPMRRHRHAD
ncbi:hypothetical protein BLNAU_12119 [Blattamonas nauphoetae]|uniref:Uncharacterized protein n=1 Tax=Blattamonas nauphoetae TaxID=2049346 RepID=A0ABQ9XKI5_9EUKA|nr:hypothetical protein BLNAU_12119 [Blattamonas nauphoetae]